jgi:pimeloyl-ACP methyl ester carboxylesterase
MVDRLAEDVVGLIDASGRDSVHLVGHDWGAMVAWRVASSFSERLSRLVIMNGPHSAVMEKNLRANHQQRLRSWYMLFFQLPVVPELALGMRRWRTTLELLKSSSMPGAYDDEDLEMYRRAWSRPGAMTSMINWYRALRIRSSSRDSARISVPTLMIWGARDTALGREMAQPSIDYCEDGHIAMLEDATHWVQHDQPQVVNRLLIEHLNNDRRSKGVSDEC